MSDTCRGSLRSLRFLAASVAVTAMLVPGVARAAWSPTPVTVGKLTGSLSDGVGHDVNGGGDSAVAWRTGGRVFVSTRPAGGSFTAPQDVGATFDQLAGAPAVVVDESGVVTVVHQHRATSGPQNCNASQGGCDLRFARGEVGSPLGPSTLLRDATVAGVPRAAVLPDGTVVVAAIDTGGPLSGVTVTAIAADGTPQASQILNDSIILTTDETLSRPGLAPGPDGRALVTWSSSVRAGTAPATGRVRGAIRSAAGAISPAVDLATRTVEPVDAGDPDTSRSLRISDTEPAWTADGGVAVAYALQTRSQTSATDAATTVGLETVTQEAPVVALSPAVPQQHDSVAFEQDGMTPTSGSIDGIRLLGDGGARLSLHWLRSATGADGVVVRTRRVALRDAAAPFAAPLDVFSRTDAPNTFTALQAVEPSALASGEVLMPLRRTDDVIARRISTDRVLLEQEVAVDSAPSTVFNSAGSSAADGEGSAQLVYLQFGVEPSGPTTSIRAVPYDEGAPTLSGVEVPATATVGQQVTFRAQASDRWTAAEPLWTIAGGTPVAGTPLVRTFTEPGTVTVSVRARDDAGNLGEPVERTVAVTAAPAPDPDPTPSPVPPPTPSVPDATPVPPAPGPTPVPPPTQGAGGPTPAAARVVLGALPRAGISLRKARRRLIVRVQVFEPGRLTLRLRRGTRTVASTTVTFRVAARRAIRLKLGATRVRPGRHTARVTFDPLRAGARTVVAARAARLRP